MGMGLGIVGLPNAGKSTLFNSITRAGAAVGNFPFTTVDRNIGVAPLRDARLERVAHAAKSKKVTPVTVQFVDIAGLVKGASAGEGLGNKFLSHIRDVDALLHVVSCFSRPDVGHVYAGTDPARDAGIVETELALSDLEVLEKRREKAARAAKAGAEEPRLELQAIDELEEILNQGKMLYQATLTHRARDLASELRLLTAKPMIYVGNVDESVAADPSSDEAFRSLCRWANGRGAKAVAICAKLEAELGELEEAEREQFRQELGLSSSGPDLLIRESYHLLDLLTFFTANETEARAWAAKRGIKAIDAAGKVHSDIKRGFIVAEVISSQDLERICYLHEAKEKGLVRLEGKDYVVRDGDLIYFRFAI